MFNRDLALTAYPGKTLTYVTSQILSAGFGAYIALAFIGAQTQIRRPRDDRTRELMIRYSITMFIVATSWYALATTSCGFAFANESSAPAIDHASGNVPGSLHYAFYALDMVLVWLANGFLLWRSYTTWGANRLVMSILAAIYTLTLFTGIANYVTLFRIVPHDAVDPIEDAWMGSSVLFSVSYSTIVAVKFIRQRHRLLEAGLTPAQISKAQISVGCAFIESAIAYSLAGVVAITLTVLEKPEQAPMTTLSRVLTFISPALIQVLVEKEVDFAQESSDTETLHIPWSATPTPFDTGLGKPASTMSLASWGNDGGARAL